jgi:HK97 gp10 family phage protein
MSVVIKDYTKDLLKELQRKQLVFVQKAAQAVRTEAITGIGGGQRVPVKTGNLKNSIQVASYVEDGIATAEVGPTAFYAPYVEYGTGVHASPLGTGSKAKKIPWTYQNALGQWFTTSGQEPQPFMEPAVKYVQFNIIPLLEKELAL